VACTFIFDFIFLCFISDAHSVNESNGGKGSFMVYFSLLCCWISLITRPIIAGIFWYDSHDFQNIIKGDAIGMHTHD
jgi:hypothetical protein